MRCLTSSNVSGNPQVAISNGTGHEVIVAWHSVINSADQIQAVISTVGGSWGTTNNLVLTTGNNQNYPKVAIDINGNAAVLWFQSNGATPVFINDLVVASFCSQEQLPGLRHLRYRIQACATQVPSV